MRPVLRAPLSSVRACAQALYAFREAARLRGDDRELLGHCALAALDVGLFEEALYHAGRALALGGTPLPQVSSLVAQAVAKDLKASDGTKTRRLLEKAHVLLEDYCAAAPTSAVHWEARLHLEQHCGGAGGAAAGAAGVKRTLRLQLAAYRNHAPWTSDAATLGAVVEVAAQLVEALLDKGDAAHVQAARKMVDGLLYAASEKLAASPGCESLRMLQSRIKRHDDDDD